MLNFEGLANLKFIGGGLEIFNNAALFNFSGLDNLEATGGDLTIGKVGKGNLLLENFFGLESLINIGGTLDITENNSLTSVNGFGNLTTIGGDLIISDNYNLNSLAGLDNITENSITDILIHDNNSLSHCNVQSICDYLSSPNGYISVYNNNTGCNSVAEVNDACHSCLSDGIVFTSQQEINSFQIMYPECYHILGSVTINGENITDLSNLGSISSVNGDLAIVNNDILTELDGLDNISAGTIMNLNISGNPLLTACKVMSICNYVANPNGVIEIHDNATGCNNIEEIEEACSSCLPQGIILSNQQAINNFANNYPGCSIIEGNVLIGSLDFSTNISNLEGFSGIIKFNGDLVISNADNLLNLSGLNNVENVGGSFKILDNDLMENLVGLENLDYVGQDFRIERVDNPTSIALNSLNGLDNLDSVGGEFRVYSCYYLQDISSLINLKSTGSLIISTIHSLPSLNGLENLTFIGENLYINWNYSLENIQALQNLTFLGNDLRISYNSLTNLTGLEGLTKVNGDLYVRDFTNMIGLNNITFVGGSFDGEASTFTGLENLDTVSMEVTLNGSNFLGLSSLKYIGGDLSIGGANNLYSMQGLDSLSYIGGSFYVSGNNHLQNFEGLHSLNYIGYYFTVEGNNNLQNFEGLNSLNHVGGPIHIYSNYDLENFIGLDSLTSISTLDIYQNGSLQSLDGLESLVTLSWLLWIEGNYSLENLDGISNIDENSINEIIIEDNLNLSTCDVESICKYIALPNADITIQYNASGCNNPGQVANACAEHCFYEGVNFTTQQQIDDFPVYYSECSEIKGDVLISGNNITNLAGLNNINEIEGSLHILDCPSLTSLVGLEGLISIGNDLWVSANNNLDSLYGLVSLNYVGGSLQINENAGLTGISLYQLLEIGGLLEVEFNGNLTSLSGLDNISPNSIENLKITYNQSLSACEVQSICSYLISPAGIVEIHDNATGCSSQEEVYESCFSCFPDGIQFTSQQQLSDFYQQYPDCHIISGDVVISGSDITSLYLLHGISRIKGNLYIQSNPLLSSLYGLHNISEIEGGLYLENNNNLSNIEALSNLTYIGQNLVFNSNNSLLTFEGLQNIKYVNGDVSILSNYGLIGLLGLDSLSTISGKLVISDNDRLHQINNLASLIQIFGSLQIMYNDSLPNLYGISNLNSGTISELMIYNNPQLSECDVLSICNFLTNPTGPCQIDLNSTGCNSIGEVQAACLTSDAELPSLHVFLVYPNPASSFITITYHRKPSLSTKPSSTTTSGKKSSRQSQ